MKENLNFKQWWLNYKNNQKPKQQKRTHNLVIYGYFFFVFSVVAKKVELLKHWKWCSYFENPYHYAKIVEKKRINFLVSLYCTLLFSRKEVIRFSEVALVFACCNCLIGCIKIAQGYQPRNTANTTVDICLLVKNGK